MMTCEKSNVALFLVRRREKATGINSKHIKEDYGTGRLDGHENCPSFYVAVPVTYDYLRN